MARMTLEQKIKRGWIERIGEFKEQLEFWESMKKIKESSAEYPGISYGGEKTSSSSNSVEGRYLNVAKCDEKIAEIKSCLEKAEFEVNSAISSIPDERHRQILIKSYIEHKSNKIVAKEVFYCVASMKNHRLKALDSLNISQWIH